MEKNKLSIILAIITTISLIGISAQCGVPSEAPTIELEIYDGPDYSESDNMCYYRIEATVTGIPDPEVEFSTDDNVSLLSSERVEVGVDKDDSYTLTATATNSSVTSSTTSSSVSATSSGSSIITSSLSCSPQLINITDVKISIAEIDIDISTNNLLFGMVISF